jgi:cellulose synthase/poly-beta-1,6-N-acetylglucosamine synthase-like glycosyltransferase
LLTDGTSEYFIQLCENLNISFDVSVVLEKKQGKANALTKGYNLAKGELILLCDDDNWLNKDYINVAVELFKMYPAIGMAAGYGSSAVFLEDKKPSWFDKFQFHYVVGKHHESSGFLSDNTYSLYGAGSIIRKSVWEKIYNSGFIFQNSVKPGKAIAEDVELSMAVVFSGYKLYFDERLTFIHDLRWGRISLDSLHEQECLNGRGNVVLIVYEIIYKLVTRNEVSFFRFMKLYTKSIFNVKMDIEKLSKMSKMDVQTKLYYAKKINIYKFMILKIPLILYEYKSVANWITKLNHGK